MRGDILETHPLTVKYRMHTLPWAFTVSVLTVYYVDRSDVNWKSFFEHVIKRIIFFKPQILVSLHTTFVTSPNLDKLKSKQAYICICIFDFKMFHSLRTSEIISVSVCV